MLEPYEFSYSQYCTPHSLDLHCYIKGHEFLEYSTVICEQVRSVLLFRDFLVYVWIVYVCRCRPLYTIILSSAAKPGTHFLENNKIIGVFTTLKLCITRFRDVQWRQIWCIVGLKVDQNKTTAVRVTVKRIFQ